MKIVLHFSHLSELQYHTGRRGFPTIETRGIISYTVTNSITVDSYKLLNVSQWIGTAVEAVVNDISSISFSLSDENLNLSEMIF
jgi:uncharacterized protein YggE